MKKIAIVLFNEVEVLDFAGPFEVFSVTGRRAIGQPLDVFTIAELSRIAARNNLIITPTFTFHNHPTPDVFLFRVVEAITAIALPLDREEKCTTR